MTSEAGGGIGGRLQSYAGLDGDIYLRGGGGPTATGVLNTGGQVLSGKGEKRSLYLTLRMTARVVVVVVSVP